MCFKCLALCSNDVEMEVDHISNGVSESSSNGFLNGSTTHTADIEDCEAEMGEMMHNTLFYFKSNFLDTLQK